MQRAHSFRASHHIVTHSANTFFFSLQANNPLQQKHYSLTYTYTRNAETQAILDT